VDERQKHGVYKDLADFVKRVGREVVNRKTLESLALAGALDEFGDRKVLFNSVEVILNFSSEYQKQVDSNQLGMFGETEVANQQTIRLVEGEVSSDQERLVWEKEYLGTFVSRHPLKDVMPRLAGIVRPIKGLTGNDDNKTVKVAGVVTRVQKVFTKNGDAMLFVTLEDLGAKIEAIVFPKTLDATRSVWERDKIVLVSGRVNVKERAENEGENIVVIAEPKILVSEAYEANNAYLKQLDEAAQMTRRAEHRSDVSIPVIQRFEYTQDGMLIKLPKTFTNGRLTSLKQTLEQHPGEMMVTLELFSDGRWQKIKTNTRAAKSNVLERELALLLK
jgi:DNA polymerase-3 subunit alpha